MIVSQVKYAVKIQKKFSGLKDWTNHWQIEIPWFKPFNITVQTLTEFDDTTRRHPIGETKEEQGSVWLRYCFFIVIYSSS
jgi:hypothetical protein